MAANKSTVPKFSSISGSDKKLPKLKISKTIKINSPMIGHADDIVDEAMKAKAKRAAALVESGPMYMRMNV